MSARGPLPINCPIEATTLQEAFEAFPKAVQNAIERLMEEARELQRQEASRIVVPGQGPGGLGGPGGFGGGPMGGMPGPGGGRIIG
ncbi:MAG: hypothetical protein R3E53_03265 [Myxococcota bacterium]